MSAGLEVNLRKQGKVGRITLNRPDALNALTMTMIEAMYERLRTWAADPDVALVLIDAAGGKAFCAGGDIQWLYAQMLAANFAEARQFFRREYRLNQLIATYPKPYVAIMQGIVIGGGVGVSAHGSHRIVTENTLLALPECSIGLIPDVGTTLLLARAPGHLGEYIGLTGYRLNGADAIAAKFADTFVPTASLPNLLTALITDPHPTTIAAFAQTPPPSKLNSNATVINAVFNGKTGPNVTQIVDALATCPADWAPAALKAIHHASPLSLHCALVAIRAARSSNDIAEALAAEYRFVSRAVAGTDFPEGIRAAVIDKDRKPRWSPSSIGEIAPTDVDAMFAPLDPMHDQTERYIP